MRRFVLLPPAAVTLLALLLAAPAIAGQLGVTVSPGGLLQFTPANVTVNPGDQVFWIWQGSGHTVTSGTAGTAAGDGTFRSSTSANLSGDAFFWKSAASGTFQYYCFPHFGFNMKGAIAINPAGSSSVADFRITEVEFAVGGGQRVQISNLGTNLDFIDMFRVTSQSGASVALPVNAIAIGAGSSVTLHLGASGTNDATNVFVPAAPTLTAAGSFALYVPNTTTGPGGSTAPASLTDANQMVDYVEWGTPGQAASPNRSTAVSANFWGPTDVVNVTDLPNGGLNYSISFCGLRGQYGATFWNKTTPNFGAGPICTTASRPSTWGRIKSLYRQ
jgi:plastocyanin